MKFNELLIGKEFYQYSHCRCGGVLTYKFRHKTLVIEVKVFPERKEFVIYNNYRKFYAGNLSNLNEQINLLC